MVSIANTKASLDALYKTVYGDKLEALVPDFAILQNKIKFDKSKKNGRKYETSVNLTHEHGFSYGSGLVTLEEAINADNQLVEVTGSPFYLRSVFTYDAAAAMVSGGKESFIKGTEYRLMKMKSSAAYRLELQLLYGEVGLGVADSSQDSVTAVQNTDEVKIPLTAASWSAAIWSGAEGAKVALFDTSGVAISGVTPNNFEVLRVDTSAKTIDIQCADGTDAAAVVTAVEGGDHNIFWYGAKGNEMTGIRSIISNTGTLFNLSGANYSLWQGNTFAAAGALTLKKVLQAVNQAVSKGLMEDVTCIVSPATFAILSDTESSFRRYPGGEKNPSAGAVGINFAGPSGNIEIMSHPLCKEGEAMIFPVSEFSRIGATDLTFKTPGKEEEMFLQLSTQTGYECRAYSDQAVFSSCPAKSILITGITNT